MMCSGTEVELSVGRNTAADTSASTTVAEQSSPAMAPLEEEEEESYSDWSEEDLSLHFSPSIIIPSDEESDRETGETQSKEKDGPQGKGGVEVSANQLLGQSTCHRPATFLRQHSMPAYYQRRLATSDEEGPRGYRGLVTAGRPVHIVRDIKSQVQTTGRLSFTNTSSAATTTHHRATGWNHVTYKVIGADHSPPPSYQQAVGVKGTEEAPKSHPVASQGASVTSQAHASTATALPQSQEKPEGSRFRNCSPPINKQAAANQTWQLGALAEGRGQGSGRQQQQLGSRYSSTPCPFHVLVGWVQLVARLIKPFICTARRLHVEAVPAVAYAARLRSVNPVAAGTPATDALRRAEVS
ncbi:unnamed protein product [Lota lota]